MLVVTSLLVFALCTLLHTHIDFQEFIDANQNGLADIQDGFLANSIIMVIAKILALISLILNCLAIISGQSSGMVNFLSSSILQYVNK